jgi:nucleoside phosphorylase
MRSRRSTLVGSLHRWSTAVSLVALLWGASAPAQTGGTTPVPPADPFCAVVSGTCASPPYVAVMSAFPAESEPLLAAASITETFVLGDRNYYVGTLGGENVVIVRGGIGLLNAAATAHELLDRFQLKAILFSGVAGSDLNIGDVAVPATWTDGTATYSVDADLLTLARTLASPPIVLETCTHNPPDPPNGPGPLVCINQAPKIVVGGAGESSDPFGTTPFACVPDGGPIFGCSPLRAADRAVAAAASSFDSEDMETAAVARVAQEAGMPFLGFRGVSDGNGDPLGLMGFLQEFVVYYRLSADNAAATTIAFLGALAARDASAAAATTSGPAVSAACDWPRAAGAACDGARGPRSAAKQVTKACTFLAAEAAADPGSAAADDAARHAQKSWGKAARLAKGVKPKACRAVLVRALKDRAHPSGG